MPLKYLFSPLDGQFHFVLAPAGSVDPAELVDNVLTQDGSYVLTQDGSYVLTQG